MASIPVAAASAGGSVRVVSGSRIASRGNSGKSAISSLTLCSWSLITAAIDTSLPVPAVVGMHASGAMSQRPAHAVVLARHEEEALLVARRSRRG